MSLTKQQRALNAANAVITICQQLTALRSTINQFITQYNSEGWSTIWDALQTAPLNADGTFGTPDGTPNPAHPIYTTTYITLNAAVTPTALVNAVAMIEQLQNFFTNQAVTSNNYNITIDDLAA